jgi:hypothetical protein
MLENLATSVIKRSFRLSVWIIIRFSDMKPYHQKVKDLRRMPEGTLGKGIASCLDDNNLQLVPKYENHDLKHVLLDFKMTPVDEIRMQAFMLGNGNYSIPCFAILFFGAFLLPNLWITLYRDYKNGRIAYPISEWTIDEYAEMNMNELRKSIFENGYYKPLYIMKTFIKTGAFASIIAGIFGMFYCLPYLFSASITNLLGAGFPFLGGCILAVGGLIVLSNLKQKVAQINNSVT